ncbi:MAG: hypothetical protein ABJN62_18020 [Halioglobus sp.]
MKKFMIVCTCIAGLTAGVAFAGHGGQMSEEDRAERMAKMKAHLELSDEQVAEMKQIRADGGNREDIRAVLSDEQAEKWDEARQKHRQKGGKKHGKGQQTED